MPKGAKDKIKNKGKSTEVGINATEQLINEYKRMKKAVELKKP